MRGIALLLVLLGTSVAAGQPAKLGEDELRRAIRDLADERFAVRQRAMKLLWEARDTAEKHLRDAANSGDPEVERQARILLDRIAYRIDPDTPRDVIALMTRFRKAAGIPLEQSQIIRDMLRLGDKARKHLLRMLDAVDNQQRQLILDQFAYDDWRILSGLIAEGQDETVGQLLDKAITARNEAVVPHYAAFQMQTGRLDGRIAEYRARAEMSGQAFDARVLLALYRLKGDPEGALWAARKAQNSAWLQQSLIELGRWPDLLAEMPQPAEGLAMVADLGYRAAFQRLAGREADFQATLQQIREYAAVAGGARNYRPWFAAKVLMVNEQPAQAMELLRKYDQHANLAEILAGRAEFREALAVSEKGAAAETGPRYAERLRHIDLLLRVGDRPRAREWLGKLVADMGDTSEPGWLDRLSQLQLRLGERAVVEKRLLARLERGDGSSLGATFAALFPRLEARAEVVWLMLKQQHPGDSPAQRLARLLHIDDGSAPANDVAKLLLGPLPVNSNSNQPMFQIVAQIVALLGQADVATALLRQPNWDNAPSDARISLADTLFHAGRWSAAAEAYRKVWDTDKAEPLPLFLHAQSLLRVNSDDARARPLIDLSHRVSLGRFATRMDFHGALLERGFNDDALREIQFCSQLLSAMPQSQARAQDLLARSLAARGDYASAVPMLQRSIFRLMPTSQALRGPTGYNRVTADIHILTARRLIAEGKTAAALKEVVVAEELHPTHLDLGIKLVPALESAGQQMAAGQLFDRLAGRWRKACTDYPDCAEAHNQLAWLLARCRRGLEEAKTHAARAVALDPTATGYLDTLAEVHFQLGDRSAALDLMKKCLTMTSSAATYRQQLKRFEKGDPKTDPVE